MTRARETSRLQVATNLDGISGLDEFTVVDTSVKLIDSNLTLNAGSSDALITIQKTHLRVDTGATLDITGDRHLVINQYNLPHTVV
jgi:hypothetical protein